MTRLDRIEKSIEALTTELRVEIKQLAREVGKVSNGLGRFAESLVGPSLPVLLPRIGVRVTSWGRRYERTLGGETMEIDFLAFGHRKRTRKRVVVVVEVALQLVPREVEWCLEKLNQFYRFFGAEIAEELLGGIAAMELDRSAVTHAERQGLLVIGPGEEVARLQNRPGFQPRVWRPLSSPSR